MPRVEKLKKNERPTHAHAPGWRAQGEDGDSGKKRSGRKEGTRAATHALTLTPVKAVNESQEKKPNAYYYGVSSYLTKKYKGIIVANFI